LLRCYGYVYVYVTFIYVVAPLYVYVYVVVTTFDLRLRLRWLRYAFVIVTTFALVTLRLRYVYAFALRLPRLICYVVAVTFTLLLVRLICVGLRCGCYVCYAFTLPVYVTLLDVRLRLYVVAFYRLRLHVVVAFGCYVVTLLLRYVVCCCGYVVCLHTFTFVTFAVTRCRLRLLLHLYVILLRLIYVDLIC